VLPLAAGINEGGHYFAYIIGPSVAVQTVSDIHRPLFYIFFHSFSFLVLLLGTAVAKTPEGVVVGFQIFAWAPK
jgi:hypothetical protein